MVSVSIAGRPAGLARGLVALRELELELEDEDEARLIGNARSRAGLAIIGMSLAVLSLMAIALVAVSWTEIWVVRLMLQRSARALEVAGDGHRLVRVHRAGDDGLGGGAVRI